MLLIIFLFFDVLVQFITDVNLLNMKVDYNLVYGRLSSVFGSEYIIGIYLFTLCYIFLGLFKIFYKNNFFEISFILIFNIAIFLTGERNAVLTSLLTLFIIFLLNSNFRKNIFISTILIFFSYFFILMNSEVLKNRYSIGAIQINAPEQININQEDIETYNQQNNFKLFDNFFLLKNRVINSQWFAHYRGELKFLKKIKLLVLDLKHLDLSVKMTRKKHFCPSHPHNIYIELLSDTGSIGLIIFLILNFFIIFKFFRYKLFKDQSSTIFFSAFIAIIFPLKPHGSLFSTNNAFMIWFILSFLIWSIIKKNEKRKN